MRIAISGASGLIGTALVEQLSAAGHTLTLLTRGEASKGGDYTISTWNPVAGEIDGHALEGIDIVINLAGANLASRWTESRKAEIRDSRVLSTRLLSETLAGLQPPPRLLLSASAIGFYGARDPEEQVDESTGAGVGFLASVCQDWEAATAAAEGVSIRVAHLRFGMVLSANGGALGRMLPVFRRGLGGKVGSGRQMISWIALPEIHQVILHLIEAEGLSGPVNLVSPNAVSNEEFTKVLAAVIGKPAFMKVRPFMARIAFGEMAEELLLAGANVIPGKLLASGYQFDYPQLSATLRYLLQTGDAD